MLKTCIRCEEDKAVIRFYRQFDTIDGLQVWCKDCKREYARQQRTNGKRTALPANASVAAAVKRGALPHISTRQCVGCDKTAEHYHHEDYDHQLVVVPLCQRCHKVYHRIRKVVAISPDGHDEEKKKKG